MNPTQYKTLAAALVGMAGSYFVGRGTFTVEQWGAVTKFLTENGPAILSAAGAVYLWWKGKPSEQAKSVAALDPETKAAAVASLPQSAQIGLVAAMPDKAVVAAAGSMDGVEVKVDTTASPGAQAAAVDPSVPGVNPA